MKKILYALFASVLLLASCDVSEVVVREDSPAENTTQIYFATATETLEKALSETSYDVTINRDETSGAATVKLILTDTAGVFSIPETVEFASGSATATITVTFNSTIKPNVNYAFTIAVEESSRPLYTQVAGYPTYTGKISLLEWFVYANGTFTSAMFSQAWPQDLYRARGTDLFEFRDLFEIGYNYRFTLGKVDAKTGLRPLTFIAPTDASGYFVHFTGYVHPSYGNVNTATDTKLDYTWFNPTGGAAGLGFFNINSKYYVSAGSFGWKDDTYEITAVHE